MATIKSFKKIENPRWGRENKSNIILDVIIKSADIDYEGTYSCSVLDINNVSREIYDNALNGDYGDIGDYMPPAPTTKKELETETRGKRDQLLKQCDWTQLPDVPESTKEKWAPYRQALRDITNQEGFPENITWPEKP